MKGATKKGATKKGATNSLPQRRLGFRPFFFLAKKEIQRCIKVLNQTIMAPVITASLYFMVFGLSIGEHLQDIGKGSYLIFLIPGMLMLFCLNNAFQNASGGFVAAKFTGEIEDYKVIPVASYKVIGAACVGSLLRGYVVSLMIYLSGLAFVLFKYQELFIPKHFFVLLYFLSMGALIFALLGVWVTLKSKSLEQISAFTNFILTPLIFLGGVFFSLEDLPPFWQKVSLWNPVFHLINGVRYGFLGYSDVSIWEAALFSLAVFLGGFWILNQIYQRATFRKW